MKRVRPIPSTWRALALCSLGLLLGGCSGGGGGASFEVTSINLSDGAVWKINRPIVITFSKPVDFSTVSLNTINVRRIGGGPSAGEFFLSDPRTVVFQPLCPRRDDLLDAGLQPGGVRYELNVLGVDRNPPITVLSVDGDHLTRSSTRFFSTPTSLLAADLFFDTTVGPPAPVVRTNLPGDDNPDATYLEIGGDPDRRHYFERDVVTGAIALDPPLDVPLNELADQGTRVALVIQFNQSVDPSSANISSLRLPWQFRFSTLPDVWRPLNTDIELVANCTLVGATVRVEPRGALPPETVIRAVVTTEFRDIVGETNLLVQDKFAVADTAVAPVPFADEHLEEYASKEFEDALASFGEPHAEWNEGGSGRLAANFSFGGTGGPGGDFDWKIPAGQIVIFNTSISTITGGPGFVPTTNQTVVGGTVDVRHVLVEDGAVLKIEGPNRFTLLASGTVTIHGTIDASGGNSRGVATLNTTNQPEFGAPGQAGGGRGGTGSPLTTASSPRGGPGFGAFNVPDGGGQGGETGWNSAPGAAQSKTFLRRGAGGGGGRLGKDQPSPFPDPALGPLDQTWIGQDAEPGFPNLETKPQGCQNGLGVDPNGVPIPCTVKGAESGVFPPQGGNIGPAPFNDIDPANDFFGAMFDVTNQTLILGELKQPWAGAGGGGGGDAAYVSPAGSTFPETPFKIGGDEKGSGAGGGGGSVNLLVLGDIVFGPMGQVKVRGGTGGGGENVSFVDRVGGGSGGGSGGHVVLQTASKIDLRASSIPNALWATGGEGGAGVDDKGGAKLNAFGNITEEPPFLDACPPGYNTNGNNACLGHWDGAGGDGSPGIVQLHTDNGLDPAGPDVLLPAGQTISDLSKPSPLCPDASCRMIPTFGRTSRARSKWISVGMGSFDVTSSSFGNIVFEFQGTDPTTGLVQTDLAGNVAPQPPILGPERLQTNPAAGLPHIQPGSAGRVLVMDATPLLGGPLAFYLRDLHLLRHFLIEMRNANVPTEFQRFDVVDAAFDSAAGTLALTVDAAGPALVDFSPPGGMIDVELQPAFLRVITADQADKLPSSSQIQIQFQATQADANGNPDPALATPFTFDIDDLNNDPQNPQLRFVRYDILFDIDALGAGLSPDNPIPEIDYLRLPLRFN